MPAAEQLVNFRFPNRAGNINNPVTGVLTLQNIRDMMIPEFVEYQGRITNLRKQYRYDSAFYLGGTAITPVMDKNLFEIGQGQSDTVANVPTTTFIKDYNLSNLFKNGQYQPGELGILYQMEAFILGLEAGTPTTSSNGMISVPAVAAFSATTDIFLLLRTISTQFYLSFLRGGQKQDMVEGRIFEFPQKDGVSGVAGSSATFVSGIAQNQGMYNDDLLQKPQVIEGQDTWVVNVNPIAPTLTVARDFIIQVRFAAYELLRQYA